ncbi:glycolipid transfer protein isoform X1 [Ovis aries]|uniref:Glycolipid transfer protein n=1 Tax=Ovis aries TaxID=9940 RepID=A0AC11CHF4_SHEEP|nr:glycolipid transfer protein isoform X1 [Ovis aries]
MALLAEHLLRPLPADKQIETGPFLEAVSHLPPFFDCLGSPVFTPIKADISGNITKIKAVYDTNPTKFRTLQNILEVEKEMYGAEWPKVGATLALMWLKRGLRFIQVFLQSICDGERDENHPNLIRVNATKAYEMALKKYHGWIVQKIFQLYGTCVCVLSRFVSNSLQPYGLSPTRDSPGKDTGVDCQGLLQEISLTQGSNLRLLHLLHCRQLLYPLSHLGSPLCGMQSANSLTRD